MNAPQTIAVVPKKLLLHICCAPDATVGIERLFPDYEITVFFYNPNIHPEKEYSLRRREMEQLANRLNVPMLDAAEYNANEWFELVKGLEEVPEGGKRCELCFQMRLQKTAEAAVQNDFPVFTTVLTVSPHKNAQIINQLGAAIGNEMGLEFIAANFKKKDGFKRSLELSRQYNLYRQDYCGCIFSQIERDKRKRQKEATSSTP